MSGSSGERPPVDAKTGDDTTGLLFGGRVSKADPAIETCGAANEAVAALGHLVGDRRDDRVARAGDRRVGGRRRS